MLVILVAVVAGGLLWVYPAATRNPPDVVLITLDTTRADHLGVYGYPLPTSPEIDEFARDAVVYTRAWSTAGWTLPSHASMLTGMYPLTHGAHYDEDRGEKMFGTKVTRLGAGAVTIAEALKKAGYATAAFAGGPWLAPEFGLLQGYDVKVAGVEGKELDKIGKAERQTQYDRDAEVLTDLAMDWVGKVSPSQRVHLLVNYFDPHAPYDVQPGFEVTGHTDPWNVEQAEGYDSEIRYMDHHFGRLLDGLKKVGRYDNSLIIVVADHGETFSEHGLFSHGPWLYEELLHVPLIIRFPGGANSGAVVDTLASTVDFFPLVAREARVPLPESAEGMLPERRRFVLAQGFRNKSWYAKFFGERLDRDLTAFVRWPWKLLVGSKGPSELYNIEGDPDELHDRAGETIEQELRRDLEAVRSTLAPHVDAGVAEEISPALRERLRALGYGE